MSEAQYDFVVFGATSFVGKILCQYLIENYRNDSDIKWAMAGRSRAKMDALKQELGSKAKNIPQIVADASDENSLREFVGNTKVVISTVGPYALYGEPLVKACAELGTDYCDLTGEVQWIRRMLTKYEEIAKNSGARIVHSCGFDSIPSDLGVYFLQQHSLGKYGESCHTVKMRVKEVKGGASGGTVASAVNLTEEASKDKGLLRELADPYSICPDNTVKNPQPQDLVFACRESEFNSWVGPFVMAGINTRMVHRSAAIAGQPYGNHFYYNEGVLTGAGIKAFLKAQVLALGSLAFFNALTYIGPVRRFFAKHIAPQPGEGPSPQEQHDGYYDFRFHGTTESGKAVQVKVTGDRDPGYGSTSKILAEAGICLAKDFPKEETVGGFWTPATMFGNTLIKRLEANAGLTFEVI